MSCGNVEAWEERRGGGGWRGERSETAAMAPCCRIGMDGWRSGSCEPFLVQIRSAPLELSTCARHVRDLLYILNFWLWVYLPSFVREVKVLLLALIK